MTDAPTRSVRLFGTDQPVAPPRLLKAGPLTAELEAGNLRYIRFSGLEMIRAISFIVRDRNRGGSVTLSYDEREVSASRELSGRFDRGPPRAHRRSAKHAFRLG